MTFKDRLNSFLHGRFVDAPSEDSLRSELAEVVDELVKARHDLMHLHEEIGLLVRERNGATSALATAEQKIETLQGQLVAAEAELHANQGGK